KTPENSELRGVNLLSKKLTDRQIGGSIVEFIPPSYDERMSEIAARGFNIVRVHTFWEAYEKDPSGYLTDAEVLAEAAERNGLFVIFDLPGQWHTGSQYFGTNYRGMGFPKSLTAPYATSQEFWKAYYTHKRMWDAHVDVFYSLIGAV